jgi:hypothetical protein
VPNPNEYFKKDVDVDPVDNGDGGGGGGGLSATALFFVIVSALVLSSLVVFGVQKAFRYHSDRGMRSEMQDIMERYVPMSDVDSENFQHGRTPPPPAQSNGSINGSNNGSIATQGYRRPTVALDTDALFGAPSATTNEPTTEGSYQPVQVQGDVQVSNGNGNGNHPLGNTSNGSGSLALH